VLEITARGSGDVLFLRQKLIDLLDLKRSKTDAISTRRLGLIEPFIRPAEERFEGIARQGYGPADGDSQRGHADFQRPGAGY
jgi:hypothetical protein